jgi:integrase/recombinase XerD
MKNKRSKEWLTKKEFNNLINHPNIPRKDELIISLLYYCALRVSELINLRVRDVDTENATICVWYGKYSDGPVLVPVAKPILKIINQWISDHKLTKTKFLLSTQDKEKPSRTQIHRIVKRSGKRALIDKNISTHSFRRSRATHLLDDGLALEQVSKLLRHKHLVSTMDYLKISIKDLQKAITKIDNQQY